MKLIWYAAATVAAIGFACSSAAAGEAVAGKDLFVSNKCQACHSIKSQDIAVIQSEGEEAADEAEPAGEEHAPPDLSAVGSRRTVEFMNLFLRKKETIDGRKHRKRFSGTEEEREALVQWLSTLKAEEKAK